MDRNAADLDRLVQDMEAANDGACKVTALRNGHTLEEAENCDDASVGCPDCPFLKGEVKMSLPTEADLALGQTVSHVQKAIEVLSKFVIEQVDGTRLYTDSYRVKARIALSNLLDVRDQLKHQ